MGHDDTAKGVILKSEGYKNLMRRHRPEVMHCTHVKLLLWRVITAKIPISNFIGMHFHPIPHMKPSNISCTNLIVSLKDL